VVNLSLALHMCGRLLFPRLFLCVQLGQKLCYGKFELCLVM
jgi:hypothetical protein